MELQASSLKFIITCNNATPLQSVQFIVEQSGHDNEQSGARGQITGKYKNIWKSLEDKLFILANAAVITCTGS